MKDWFLAWLNISVEAFWHWLSNVSAEPFGMEDLFLAQPSVSDEPFRHWLTGVSVGPFWQCCGRCSHMVRCECWACLSDMTIGLVRTWTLKKTYMEARLTTSMKKGWLYRTSCDEKNHEIAPVMFQWWWSSSDDPDWVMIQIQLWWSSDVLDWVWSSDDDPDPDEDDLKIEMTWRWRWRELNDDPDDTEKKTHAENCVERIPS